MAHSILIVDDEPGIRQSLTGVLEDEGFAVTTAASGEECLQSFERRLYACVLLDVWLPGIDGLETLARLKANYPDTSVVMISGHGRIRVADGATKLGVPTAASMTARMFVPLAGGALLSIVAEFRKQRLPFT